MKKLMIVLFICLFLFPPLTNAMTLTERLSGKILLQVESKGEAWYVNPNNNQRYYLGRPDDAFRIMRELGLGIKHDELEKYKKSTFPKKFSGKIFLDVEEHGEAYYVYPVDLKAYYLGRPDDAFQIMREKGLGITNNNLDLIQVNSEFGYKDESYILATESTESLYPINLINNPKWEIEIKSLDEAFVEPFDYFRVTKTISNETGYNREDNKTIKIDSRTGKEYVYSNINDEFNAYISDNYLKIHNYWYVYPNLLMDRYDTIYEVPINIEGAMVKGKKITFSDKSKVSLQEEEIQFEIVIKGKKKKEVECNVKGVGYSDKTYYTKDSAMFNQSTFRCFVNEKDAIENGYSKSFDN